MNILKHSQIFLQNLCRNQYNWFWTALFSKCPHSMPTLACNISKPPSWVWYTCMYQCGFVISLAQNSVGDKFFPLPKETSSIQKSPMEYNIAHATALLFGDLCWTGLLMCDVTWLARVNFAKMEIQSRKAKLNNSAVVRLLKWPNP